MKIFWVSLFILLAENDLKRSLQIERNQPPPSDKSPELISYQAEKMTTHGTYIIHLTHPPI